MFVFYFLWRGKMRCLIIEDELLERRALEKLFKMCFPSKFEYVASAMNGNTGLKMLENSDFDLVILDINLPDLEGTEILSLINKNYPETKVIMATAYSDYEHIRKSMRNNAFDYLLKPYSIDTFKEAINVFISSVEEESFGTANTIGKIKKYIEENYMKDIGLEDIASAVGFDKSYIGRIFKKSEGKTIMNYVLEYRIEKANSLIKKGMSVSEVSYAVGFNDPAYFSKCFKKVTGTSPSSKSR